MRPLLPLSLVLVACAAPEAAGPPDPLAGAWPIAGRHPDGEAYDGTLRLEVTGPDLFRATWRAPNVSRGVALRVRGPDALVTGYRLRDEVGVGVYVQGERLHGVWSNGRGLGSEDVQVQSGLRPPGEPDGARTALDVAGEWTIDGWDPGADRQGPPSYRSTATVQPRDDGRCSITWLAPSESHGVGLLDGRSGLLVAAYRRAEGVGVIALSREGEGLAGPWTSDDGVGLERWRRTASYEPPMGAARAERRASPITSELTGQATPTIIIINETDAPKLVALDGQPLVTVEPGARAEVELAVGAHGLAVEGGEPMRVTVKAGSAYTLRLTP